LAGELGAEALNVNLVRPDLKVKSIAGTSCGGGGVEDESTGEWI
jgi:hypothetical protein